MKVYRNGIKGNWPDGFKGWGDDMNNNLKIMGVLQSLSAIGRNTTAQPGSAKEFDVYITPDPYIWGSGAGKIAVFLDGQFEYLNPVEGQIAYIQAEQVLTVFTGGKWSHGTKIFKTEDEEKAHFAALLNEIKPEPEEP